MSPMFTHQLATLKVAGNEEKNRHLQNEREKYKSNERTEKKIVNNHICSSNLFNCNSNSINEKKTICDESGKTWKRDRERKKKCQN